MIMDLLRDLAEKYRNRPVFWEKQKSVSHASLISAIDHLAYNLEKMGIKESDRICIALPNSIGFITAFFAARKIGAIPVLADPGLPKEKISYILQDSGARVFLGHNLPGRGEMVKIDDRGVDITAYLLEELPPGKIEVPTPLLEKVHSLATIIYTSGTTGSPKGVMLSAKNLDFATRVIVDTLNLTREDTGLISMNFAHCAGLLHLLAHIRAGASSIVGETPAFLGDFLKSAKEHGATILPSVPSFFSFLLGYRRKKIKDYLGKLRVVEVSSALATKSLIAKMFEAFSFAEIYNTYGLTEAPRTTYHRITEDTNRELCVGRPNPEIEIEILQQKGSNENDLSCGEIAIQGPNVALGYWNNLDATRKSFDGQSFKSGDIGFVDGDFLFLRGRNDNMIKIGADKVYPEEIEEIVCRFPGVAESLACRNTDPVYGNVLHLKVVKDRNSVSERALLEHCRKNLEKIKVPAKIEFCDSIPLSASGKPKREKT